MIGLILTGLLKANLAAGAGVLVVAALRTLVRPRFGAGASYLMWLAPLAAGLAVLAPHPVAQTLITPMVLSATAAVEEFVATAPASVSAGPDLASLAFGLWIAGGLAAAAVLLSRQAAFLRAMGRLEAVDGSGLFRAEHSGVGPAVVGVLKPRIVAPADFEIRFGPKERELILAHEGVHLRRGDAAVNALACAAQCLCWFNPLVHLAAHLLRIDQELACDATVIDRFPAERRTYAELLLKTQLATQALPLGCHWPAGSAHPLKARIAMLKAPLPERAMRAMGLAVVASVTLGAGAMAWSASPAAPGRDVVQSRVTVSDPAAPVADGADLRVERWTTTQVKRERTPGVDGSKVAQGERQPAPRDNRMNCVVGADGKLTNCSMSHETPDFLRLRVSSRDVADPPASGAPTIVRPDWIEKPTGADITRFYPPEAAKQNFEGRTSLSCAVDLDGRLTGCVATPAVTFGMPDAMREDFRKATLELAAIFRMRPQTVDGMPTAGGLINIPIRWALPNDAAAVARLNALRDPGPTQPAAEPR